MAKVCWGLLGLLLLAAAYVSLAGFSLRRKSVTVDEFAHLPAGLNVLNSGDTRYCALNPPLMNVLSAIPVWVAGVRADWPEDWPEQVRFENWPNGYVFMNQNRGNYQAYYLRSRYVTVAIVGLLGLVVFFWGRMLVPDRGNLAALLAAGLIWFSPNILAHARLVTTDAGTMAFMILATFALFLFLRAPGWPQALFCGTALGAAQLVKFTAVYLFPSFLVTIVTAWIVRRELRTRGFVIRTAAILATCLLVVNLGYGFQQTMTPLGEIEFTSRPFQSLARAIPHGCPVPFPEDYVLAFDRQLADSEYGDPSYLFGESYFGGKWYYFIAVLAVKMPIPSMILLGLAIYAAFKTSTSHWFDTMLILLPAALVFVTFSFLSNKQLGLRMILPSLGLLWIWTGTTLARFDWPKHMRVVFCIVLAWLAIETVGVYPNYLTYFNQFAGGPSQGHLYALDSNLDWGQDLVMLEKWMKREGVSRLQLLYFGRVDPEVYGIDYELTRGGVHPGYLAVSRTLYGRDYLLYDHGQLVPFGPLPRHALGDMCPIATIGNSIDIYQIGR